MKTRITSILQCKVTTVLFAFALFVFGVLLWGADKSTVQAAVHMSSNVSDSTFDDYYFMEVSKEFVAENRGKNIPVCEDKDGNPIEGYVFAGYFTKKECRTKQEMRDFAVYKNTELNQDTYYAKFVAEDVLGVKVQVSNDDVNKATTEDERYMRLVSSVEAVGYATVGFQVKYEVPKTDASGNPITDENGAPVTEWKYKRNSSQLVYKRVVCNVNEDNPAYSFSPKVMDTESEFFITSTWKGPDNQGITDHDQRYCVRAFWKTFDGVTVAGTFRYVSVNDGKDRNIVNLTVKDAGETKKFAVGTPVNVQYDNAFATYAELADTVYEDHTTAEVIYHDGTYAYLNITLGNDPKETPYDRAFILHSATWFNFPDQGVKVLYRNLYSSHTEENVKTEDTHINGVKKASYRDSGNTFNVNYKKHHEDHTWFDTYLAYETGKGANVEKNVDEYVIASSADLYGFLELSLINGAYSTAKTGSGETAITFKDKTIYICNDITINDGEAVWTSNDAIGQAPTAEWVPTTEESGIYEWYAIYGFGGVLDGQDHVISGLYAVTDTEELAEDNADRSMYYFTPGVGFMTVTQENAKIRNFNIVNSFYRANYKGTGGVSANGSGTFENIFTDVVMDSATIYQEGQGNRGFGRSGGIIGQVINSVTITNCWSDCDILSSGAYLGGIVGSVQTAETTLSHCLFSGHIYYSSSTYANAGGLVGKAYTATSDSKAPGDLYISDCLSVGKIDVPTKASNAASSTMEAHDDSHSGNIIGTIGHVGNATNNLKQFTNVYGIINHSYGANDELDAIGFIPSSSGQAQPNNVCFKKADLIGEAAKGKLTDFVFGPSTSENDVEPDGDKKTWYIQANSTPIPSYFIGDKPEEQQEPEGENPFKVTVDSNGNAVGRIKNLEELHGFRKMQNAGELDQYGSNLTIYLDANIEINENADSIAWEADSTKRPVTPWIPIKNFKGTFEGNNNTISGLYGRQGAGQTGIGLFTLTNNATIQNLNIANSYIETNSGRGTGALVGCGSGTFKHIHVLPDVIMKDTEITARLTSDASCSRVGGIIGKTTGDVIIEDCWYEGTIKSGYNYVGGMVGQATGYGNWVVIQHCLNSGKTYHQKSELPNSTTALNITEISHGGMIGYSVLNGNIVIDDCLTTGDVVNTVTDKAVTSFGTIAGSIGSVGSGTLAECSVTNANGVTKTVAEGTTPDVAVGNANKLGAMVDEGKINGYDAYYYTDLSIRVFEKDKDYWGAQEGGQPMLVSYMAPTLWLENEPVAGLAGNPNGQYRIENGKFYIFSAYHLRYIKDAITNGVLSNTATSKIYLVKDLTTSQSADSSWSIPGYQGIFDGKGHKIFINSTTASKEGLFTDTTETAVIQDLSLEINNLVAQDNLGTSPLIDHGAGTIKNVYVKATIESNKPDNTGHRGYLGGLVGKATGDVNIENCWSDCTINTNSPYTGGFVGTTNKQTVSIKHCLSTCVITVNVDSLIGFVNNFAGGIIGNADGLPEVVDTTTGNITQRAKLTTVEDCFSRAKIVSYQTEYAIGSVIGAGNRDGATIVNNTYSANYTSNFVAADNITGAKGESARALHWISSFGNTTAGNHGFTISGTAGYTGTNAFADNFFGLLAKENASTLSYKTSATDANPSRYWVCIDGDTPKLACFVTGTDVVLY